MAFQSTHPSGVRLTCSSRWPSCVRFQSTHPSGVRPPGFHPSYTIGAENFNPRTPVGCDDNAIINPIQPPVFQSTHPSGVRHSGDASLRIILNFNPRTPVGCDAHGYKDDAETLLFQSTHPSGVRPPLTETTPQKLLISIHAPQWGATPALTRPVVGVSVFHSTHPSGGRPADGLRGHLQGGISIHAPQWGATMSAPALRIVCTFQSTHPSGVRR